MTDVEFFKSADYYQQVLGALALIVVLAMVLERALSVPFEWGPIKDFLEQKKLRSPLAFVAAWAICWQMKFDLLPILAHSPPASWNPFAIGVLITAGVIAGGSKGAILLFQGILGFGKEAVDASVAKKTMAASGQSPPQPMPSPSPPGTLGLRPAAAPPPSVGGGSGMARGIDTNANCAPHAQCIVADGSTFVCRYYRPGNTGAITAGEAQTLIGAGLSIVPVFEGSGNSAGWFTAQQGMADAQSALRHASTIGQPAGSAIYFAVDFDAGPGQVGSAVSAYFKAINDIFRANGAPYRIGVYGSGLVCSTIIGANLASLGWLSGSKGWRGYTGYAPNANIVQIITQPVTTICNGALAVDRDIGQSADIGAFSTLAAPAPAAGAALVAAAGPWWHR